mmetsp:Transcript_24325/g.52683  ORF Transcript_24325/g.52683 Transcript_24325/m.52683 type:complete len:218 (+) Transcript_24325:528-1181(+)
MLQWHGPQRCCTPTATSRPPPPRALRWWPRPAPRPRPCALREVRRDPSCPSQRERWPPRRCSVPKPCCASCACPLRATWPRPAPVVPPPVLQRLVPRPPLHAALHTPHALLLPPPPTRVRQPGPPAWPTSRQTSAPERQQPRSPRSPLRSCWRDGAMHQRREPPWPRPPPLLPPLSLPSAPQGPPLRPPLPFQPLRLPLPLPLRPSSRPAPPSCRPP